MARVRRLRSEMLESRRLLAGDFCTDGFSNSSSLVQLQELAFAQADEVPVLSGQGEQFFSDSIAHFSRAEIYLRETDTLQEVDGRIFALQSSLTGAELFVFERTASGELEKVGTVEINFAPSDMFVDGDQVVLLGTDNGLPGRDVNGDGVVTPIDQLLLDHALSELDANGLPIELPQPPEIEHVALTINLGEEITTVLQVMDSGYLRAEQDDGRLVLQAPFDGPVIQVIPPPPASDSLHAFEITSDGLRKIGEVNVPIFGQMELHGNDLYHAAVQPLPLSDVPTVELTEPEVKVVRFKIGDETIDDVGSLSFGGSFLERFEVADGGFTAILSRETSFVTGQPRSVDLIDLSNDEIRLFESVEIPNFSGQVVSVSDNYVVLRGYDQTQSHTTLIVDVNQEIDIAAENRVTRLELPDGVHTYGPGVRLGENHLIVRGGNFDPTVPSYRNVGDQLLILSLTEAGVVTRFAAPSYTDVVVIDGDAQRFGWVNADKAFVFGQLSASGEFDRQGLLEVHDYVELDANADRLLVQGYHELREFSWDPSVPPIVTPLLPAERPIHAVNDAYVLHDSHDQHVLDILANDRFDFRFPPPKIVELIEAPDGVEIVDGHFVSVAKETLSDVDSLRFEYVIANETSESRAVVEIEAVRNPNNDAVEELVREIRELAAEDFGIAIEWIEITAVERVFDAELPVVLPDGTEIDLSPGILVTVVTPDNSFSLYAASLEGEIVKVSSTQQDLLVEVELKPVDANGEAITEIHEGDTFWLELTAEDLRTLGQGVYAAYFDLLLPTENLVATGEYEYLSRFRGFDPIVTPGELDEMGAFDQLIEASPQLGPRSILRFEVEAIAAGDVVLQPTAADHNETLIRGRDVNVPEQRVSYKSTELTISPAPEVDPVDVNGDGDVTPFDAVMVINFLSEYGVQVIDDFLASFNDSGDQPQGEQVMELATLQNLDTNRNGSISPIDVLRVVNKLSDNARALSAAARAEQVVPDSSDIDSPVPTPTDSSLGQKTATFAVPDSPSVVVSHLVGQDSEDDEDENTLNMTLESQL